MLRRTRIVVLDNVAVCIADLSLSLPALTRARAHHHRIVAVSIQIHDGIKVFLTECVVVLGEQRSEIAYLAIVLSEQGSRRKADRQQYERQEACMSQQIFNRHLYLLSLLLFESKVS